jgi:mono/diheme cytochrome c family protein
MLNKILSIAGKPGLYKLVSQGKNMLIVESLLDGRRSPAYGNDKIVSLGDISMFTNEEDVPLRQVLKNMLEKEQGAEVALDAKKAKADELAAYLQTVLPDFDRDRVHPNDIRKLISWYNILVKSGNTEFEEKSE